MSKFIVFFLIFAGGVFSCVNAAPFQVVAEHPLPLLSKPDFTSKVYGIAPAGSVIEVSPQIITEWTRQHPLAWFNHYHELTTPWGKAYLSPEVRIKPQSDTVYSLYPCPLIIRATAAVLLATLLVLIARMGLKHRAREGELILIALLVREILVLIEFGFVGNCIPAAADDTGYFRTMADMLQGNFAGPWSFTIGTGLLYLPFMLATQAQNFYDIAVSVDWFNALVTAPAILVVSFLILRKLNVPKIPAFIAILLWALWPFFVFHQERWDILRFAPVILPPNFVSDMFMWTKYYSMAINAGFNAMSDTPGMLLVLFNIYLAQILKPQFRPILAIGALFGLACLVRINYIFFAPLLGFIIMSRREISWRSLGLATLAGALGFFAVFGIQLWINYHQFGSVLTFGYSLHYPNFAPIDRPDAGFTWHTLTQWRNLKFLCGGNRLLLALGAVGLLGMTNRYRRVVLSYLGIILFLFFLGYSHTFCDVRRFIMPGATALLGAFCALELWKNWQTHPVKQLALIVLAAVLIFCELPFVLGGLLALIWCRAIGDGIQELRYHYRQQTKSASRDCDNPAN